MARYAYGPSQMVTKCTLPHWVVAWHQLLGTAQGTQLLLHAEINLCIWFWWSYNNYWFVGLVSSLWCCTQLQQHCILQYILWSDIKPSEKHFCCANVGPTTIVSAFLSHCYVLLSISTIKGHPIHETTLTRAACAGCRYLLRSITHSLQASYVCLLSKYYNWFKNFG